MPHLRRPRVSRHRPHHITARVVRGTWNLRSQRCFPIVRRELARICKRERVRVVHFSVQHNHLHLLVEAEDRIALSNALRALFSRVARLLNVAMGTRGARFVDRYHEHVLRTPSEVRNALHYVLGNRAVHEARWGIATSREAIDPCSSLAVAIACAPDSWLLREGWMFAPP